jgi:hypothetical protein
LPEAPGVVGFTTIAGPPRSEYCGGSSTIPASLGGGSASSTSVWTINLEGVYVDAPAIAAFRCALDWTSLGADGLGADGWEVCTENRSGCVAASARAGVEWKGSTGWGFTG